MSKLGTALLYWHTLKYLRARQVFGRIWLRIARPRVDGAPAAPRRGTSGRWVTPARRPASMTGPESFLFLNEPGDLDALGWEGPQRSHLWRYNQHYFDDLNAEGAAERLSWHHALMQRWIAENPPATGTGWDPYPTSLRIVNWIKHALTVADLPREAQQSLAVQARWLARRLEWHLLGNHLFANAKALLFASFFFEGREAERWRRRAVSILRAQLPEQILPDGGHFELSPMYHALAIEDLADMVNLIAAFGTAATPAEAALARDFAARLPGMLEWLDAMSHPDGRIAFFNDATFGIAPATPRLKEYAHRLGVAAVPVRDGLIHLEDTGFARLERGAAILICDIGNVGPDYLPGHAHADTLSFELSLGDERVVVNSGTSEYGLSAERLRQRGTAAHSTVLVGAENSSEMWSGFRVARRARVDNVATAETAEALSLCARHDGYSRFPLGPRHTRRWRLDEDRLTITDQLEPSAAGEARYHLPPGVAATISGPETGTIRLASGRILNWRANGASAHVEPSTWHPGFGMSQPAQCLAVSFSGSVTFDLDFS
ncbi:heparinase [Defluviimonas sp. 20V17]|uniref:Uncharacterized conserved protein, heparinase superfamily n=1 Tax=Allgaiera indica TaxID=765699 RepID=A0AAN5A0M8_9RHOB|nr:heparinase II/III family protein [Allgaiera indica]KDB05078.1 heparinase [Defluviimonas sp. 20V17]GHE04536.1 hypothetical protein GCM10008024_32060 [Allgaiera indica]SDX57454.1 Uncharacterized conserved protein, heparinase superfamily [Allgaiera indica]